MRGFIRNALGYMTTGAGVDVVQVTTAGGSTPLFFSLVDVEKVTLTGEPVAGDVRSGDLVTIRSREGIYLTAEASAGGLVLMNAYRGNDTARMGKDVYRISAPSRSTGDAIVHGDRVRFVLMPPVPVGGLGEDQWITTGVPSGRLYFFRRAVETLPPETFEWVEEHLHLASVQLPATAEQPFASGSLQAEVTLSGPAGATLPGGFALRVSSEDAPLSGSQIVVVPGEVGTHPVQIALAPHGGLRGGCDQVHGTITVTSVVRDEERSVHPITFRPQPSPHLAASMVRVVRTGGCLAGIIGILPWRMPTVCFARLERLPAPDGATAPATALTLTADHPRIQGLPATGGTVAEGAPLFFSFQVTPGAPGERACATLRADFMVGRTPLSASFAVELHGDEVRFA